MSETTIKEKAAVIASNPWAITGTVVALVCALVSGFNAIVDLSYQAGIEKQKVIAISEEVEKAKAGAVAACTLQNIHQTKIAVLETDYKSCSKDIGEIKTNIKDGFREVNQSIQAINKK